MPPPEFLLKNKWVLITGASSGFGAAAAVQFAAAGARLLLGARRVELLAEVAARARLAAALRAAGFLVHPSEANFLLVDFATPECAVAADVFLRQRGIIVRNVKSYGLPSCLRVTIGTDEECAALAGALGEFAFV